MGYADADWGNESFISNDINDRKSISGHVSQVFGNLVSWLTRKQSTLALSSTEAEYASLRVASREAVWMTGIPMKWVFVSMDRSPCMKIIRLVLPLQKIHENINEI